MNFRGFKAVKYKHFSVSRSGRVINVRFLWRKSKHDMREAYKNFTHSRRVSNNFIGVISYNKNTAYIGLSGTGSSLVKTIIHECVHLGQHYEKRSAEGAAEITSIVADCIILALRKMKTSGLKGG